jgi:hypothetical protein
MRRENDRSGEPGHLSAALYFHAQPGMGWRLHISKVAAEIRIASPSVIPRPFRGGKKVPTD